MFFITFFLGSILLLVIFAYHSKIRKLMPEICRFYGIIISLYWRDHNPPHIHFSYREYECSISVFDRIVSGEAPAKVIEMERKKQADAESKIKSIEESIQALSGK